MKRTLILFALGATITFVFDEWYTLLPGVLLLIASIISGVFAVATPDFLEDSASEPGDERL